MFYYRKLKIFQYCNFDIQKPSSSLQYLLGILEHNSRYLWRYRRISWIDCCVCNACHQKTKQTAFTWYLWLWMRYNSVITPHQLDNSLYKCSLAFSTGGCMWMTWFWIRNSCLSDWKRRRRFNYCCQYQTRRDSQSTIEIMTKQNQTPSKVQSNTYQCTSFMSRFRWRGVRYPLSIKNRQICIYISARHATLFSHKLAYIKAWWYPYLDFWLSSGSMWSTVKIVNELEHFSF